MLIDDYDDLRLVQLRSGKLVPITLFTIKFPGTDGAILYYADSSYDVTYKGIRYDAHNSFIDGVSPPADSADLTRDLLSVSFLPKDIKSMRALFENYTGIQVTIIVVFRLADQLYTEPVAGYKGKVVAKSETIDNKKSLFVITCAGALRKLDGVLAMIATANNQKIRDENDTSLEWIHTAREVGWGLK